MANDLTRVEFSELEPEVMVAWDRDMSAFVDSHGKDWHLYYSSTEVDPDTQLYRNLADHKLRLTWMPNGLGTRPFGEWWPEKGRWYIWGVSEYGKRGNRVLLNP